MRRVWRILRWLLVLVVAVAAIGVATGYVWLRGSLPQISGTVGVQGITAPVAIARDAGGIPHIQAQNEQDALFGLGYVHAQDRLWQMEFQRRAGNGRLSEVIGDLGLDTDKFMRTVGTARAASAAWRNYPPEARPAIEAYVAGINAFISAKHGRELPIEFTVFNIAPEPWRPEDVLVWGKMMAMNLGGNWNTELLRAKLVAKLGAERTAQLFPPYPDGAPLIAPGASAAYSSAKPREGGALRARRLEKGIDSFAYLGVASRIEILERPSPAAGQHDGLLAIHRTLEQQLGLGGQHIGSNSWVVGGSRTTTGKPLLANDPHLGAQIPSIWYLAHLTGGKLDVIGATLPGIPAVIIGHNARSTWGLTNTGADVQDLYVEHINDRNQAEYNGALEPLTVIQETIHVKGQDDVVLPVRISRHGPIISDVTGDKQTLALRWTALDDEDRSVAALLALNMAGDWRAFGEALAQYKAPIQNFIYADVDGNIGYYSAGALPIRRAGQGALPVEGWTGANEWAGYVPFADLPHVFNPPEGYIVTANNKVAPDSYPYTISQEWAAPYRAARIVELIGAKPRLSPGDVAAMQADVRSEQARQLLPYLVGVEAQDERSRQAIALLKGWDATMSGDSPQPAIYVAWYQQLIAHIFGDELGADIWDEYEGYSDQVAVALPRLLQGQGGAWCDDVTTAPVEDCASIIRRALTDGLAEMAQAQGSEDLSTWRWDRVHLAIFPHIIFHNVEFLRGTFSRSIPNGGDGFTVNYGPASSSGSYKQYDIPSYRQIVDLADMNESRFMYAAGQSGHVFSPHYSDLLERWQRVEYLPMRLDATAPAERLMLEPAST